MSKSSGKAWPYGIALSFVGIIALIIGTIIVASNNAVEPSDLYMQNYHEVDENANEIIMTQIAFNKKYAVAYLGKGLDPKETVVAYRITDKSGTPVNDAKISVVITRPNTHAYNLKLENPTLRADGEYEFASITLPKEGRWNIMADIRIGSDQRYYNLKADTRQSETFEF